MNKKTLLKFWVLNLILALGVLVGITLNVHAETKGISESEVMKKFCEVLTYSELKPLMDGSSCCHDACKDDFHEGFGNCMSTIRNFWTNENYCSSGKGAFYENKENRSTCDTAHNVVKYAGDLCVSGICDIASCQDDKIKRFCGYLCCNMTGQDLWHECLGGSCRHERYVQPGCLK